METIYKQAVNSLMWLGPCDDLVVRSAFNLIGQINDILVHDTIAAVGPKRSLSRKRQQRRR